jgi:hypothetical protein
LIAKLVGYSEARANYALLNQIPDQLRKHADRVRSELDVGQQQLAALRQNGLVKAGGGPIQEKAALARSALDASEADLAAANREFEARDKEYGALVGRDNQGAFAQAIDLMAENDSRDDVVTLYKEAARTRTNEDRTLVEQIDQLTRAIAKADAEIAGLRGKIREVASRRGEIQQALNEFRQRSYDYPGTNFGNGGTINDVLGGILEGVVRGAVLGQVLQQGYQRPPSSTWGGGIVVGPGPMFPPNLPSPPSDPAGGGFDTGGSF